MGNSQQEDVTGLLAAWKSGSDEALDDLIPIVYAELRRLAGQQLRRERPDHSLEVLSLSVASVKRDWSVAKPWLRRALEGADPP